MPTKQELFRMSVALRQDDPYPAYRHFRSTDPVHNAGQHRGWYLFRYDDVLQLTTDSRFSSEQGWPDLSQVPELLKPMMEMRSKWMLNRDPPEHTRLRAPLARTFTPQRVARLVPQFEELADSLLDSCVSRERFDAIQDYALPFVRSAMADLSGIPEADRALFSRLVGEIERTTQSREAIERNAVATRELGAMYAKLLRAKKTRPTDDLVSRIAHLDDGALSFDERVAACVLVISAGAGVTAGAIGNGLVSLLANPVERARFAEGRVEPSSAIDELLRFDSTSVAVVRIATEDLEIGGVRILRGQKLTGLLGSANRDPAAFDHPDRLMLDRCPRDHLAFGKGVHHCIGASLGREQMRVALQRLLARAPELRRTADPLRWRGGLQRALASLYVAV